MWSWQSKADGITMAVDVKVGVGRFLPVIQKSHHPQSTDVGLSCRTQAGLMSLSPAARLIFPSFKRYQSH